MQDVVCSVWDGLERGIPVLYVNGAILDDTPTGLGVYTSNVVREMVDAGEDLLLFAPVPVANVRVSAISKYVRMRYGRAGGLARFLWTQLALPLYVGRGDVLYHPFHHLSFFAPARQVMTIHDLIVLHYPGVSPRQYRYFKWIMPHLLRRAACVICDSESTGKDVVRFFGIDAARVRVVHDGYNDALFHQEGDRAVAQREYGIDSKYILLVGVTLDHKNIHTALEAYRRRKDQLACKMLVVGGRSPYRAFLESCVKEQGLAEDVRFLGYVSDDRLAGLYRGAECLLYPSLYEGFGLPVLEAMACGAPVLCSSTSSLPEAGGDAALYFDPTKADEMGELLVRVIQDEGLRNQLRAKGLEHVKRFSWKRTAQAIRTILHEVAQTHS